MKQPNRQNAPKFLRPNMEPESIKVNAYGFNTLDESNGPIFPNTKGSELKVTRGSVKNVD